MKLTRFVALALFAAATSAWAQNAVLTANTTRLAPSGGTVVLTASANYAGEPGALGWEVALPANWSLESVSGANVPQIAPQAGTTGTLEFAYTTVPSQRAEFVMIVRYPAGATTATAKPTVLLRDAGKLTTLKPATIELRTDEAARAQRSRN